MAGNPLSPTAGSSVRDQYTTSTPGLNRHMTSRSHLDIGRPYTNSYPDTPRALLSPHSTVSFASAASTMYGPSSASYSHAPRSTPELPPFQEQEIVHEIRLDDLSTIVRPQINAKIEKGFFMSSDGCWTCYRRNYFSVACHYTLDPYPSGRRLYLVRHDAKSIHQQQPEAIQALAISLSAAVDGSAGKNVDLVQHTPKRDKGPQSTITKTKLSPSMPTPKVSSHQVHEPPTYYGLPSSQSANITPVSLPLQNSPDGSPLSHDPHGLSSSANLLNTTPPHSMSHTFERIQFKSATANNGKRRAQQQYYHLIVELWADVRATSDSEPKWVKVVQRPSSQVVVRGRSPSHYQNEGPNSTSRGGASGGLGGRHNMSNGGWGPIGGSLPSNHSYGGSPSLQRYGLGPSGSNYHTMGSVSEPLSGLHQLGHMNDHMSDTLRSIPSSTGSSSALLPVPDDEVKPPAYAYYPGTLADAGLTSPPDVKMERHLPREHGTRAPGQISLLSAGACRSATDFHTDTSRGYYQYTVQGNGM